MKLSEHVIYDYATTSLSIKAHPVSFVRGKLQQLHVLSASHLINIEHGRIVKVAGLILVRQRPGTAKGVCFITIEDETGIVNLVLFQKIFDQYRKEIIQSKLLMVEGEVQKEGEGDTYNCEAVFQLLKITSTFKFCKE
jgi:error-prone DNA polymerase